MLDQFYAKYRMYDASDRRFTTIDPIRDGTNWYIYVENNPVMFVDPLGLWMEGDDSLSDQARVYIDYYTSIWEVAYIQFAAAKTDELRKQTQTKMDEAHNLANDIRYLDSVGAIGGYQYNVPLYEQGRRNLCWAYSETMIESYQKGVVMEKDDADARAKEIAQSVHGDEDWNKGGWPVNSYDVVLEPYVYATRYKRSTRINQDAYPKAISSAEALMDYLADGPVYAYFLSDADPAGKVRAHLIVITGVVTASGHEILISSNNPWGVALVQTFEQFGCLGGALKFRGILRVDL